MSFTIRPAAAADASAVSATLREAAHWLADEGIPLWRGDEITDALIHPDVMAGLYVLAEDENGVAGVVRVQLEDLDFWPDVPLREALYLHRLAVRRRFAGHGISTKLLQWCVEKTRALGRPWLRLDCEASRPKLRALYERFGFTHHSDRQVGPYFVARYELRVTPA